MEIENTETKEKYWWCKTRNRITRTVNQSPSPSTPPHPGYGACKIAFRKCNNIPGIKNSEGKIQNARYRIDNMNVYITEWKWNCQNGRIHSIAFEISGNIGVCLVFAGAGEHDSGWRGSSNSSSGRTSKISADETENSMYWTARFHWPAPGSHPDVIVMTRNHWHAQRPCCMRGPQPALYTMTESGFGKERLQRQFWARQSPRKNCSRIWIPWINNAIMIGRGLCQRIQHCINMHPNQRNQPVNKNSSQRVDCFVYNAHRNLKPDTLPNEQNLRSRYSPSSSLNSNKTVI